LGIWEWGFGIERTSGMRGLNCEKEAGRRKLRNENGWL
jgi:hypothetical protein